MVGWFCVRPRGPAEAPLPQELTARAELWGKAWIANDRSMLRRLTDPACDKALHPWLQHHLPPQLAEAGAKKDAAPEAEIAVRVDRTGEHQAVLVVQVKSRWLKAPIEVRQSWVERGDAWYFVPS